MSSRGGPSIEGNRSRRIPTISLVSSTRQGGLGEVATGSRGPGPRPPGPRRAIWTRIVRSGAWPLVPSTSSWPWWPISTIVRPSWANLPRLHVHLRDERTGGVDHLEIAGRRVGVDLRVRPRGRTAPRPRPRAPRSPHRRRPRPWTRGRARRAGCGRSACGRRPARRAWPARARPRRPHAPRRRNSREGRRGARCPLRAAFAAPMAAMVAGGPELAHRHMTSGHRFGCRSQWSPLGWPGTTRTSGPLLPGATMRNLLPKVGVRMPACAREPGLGRPRSCDRSHRDGYRPTGGDVRTHDLPRGRRRTAKSSPHSRTTRAQRPVPLTAGVTRSMTFRTLRRRRFPAALAPNRRAPDIVPAASHAGAATPGAGYRGSAQDLPYRLARRNLPRQAAHPLRRRRVGPFRAGPPRRSPSRTASPVPAPCLQRYSRAAGIYQHLRHYWPGRARVYGFRGWSAFNARANIIVTMRMVHRGGWGSAGAS